MYTTWSLWTNFLKSVNRTAGAAPIPPDRMCNDPTTPDKVSKVNFRSTESPLAEEVVLPLDWAEYLIFRERMHRRRSTGSHIIRGIKRIRIKRLRSDKKEYRGMTVQLLVYIRPVQRPARQVPECGPEIIFCDKYQKCTLKCALKMDRDKPILSQNSN